MVASAAEIQRGVARALIGGDHAVLSELPLADGRRADLVAVDHAGRITLVEIKSCRADFLCDRKWQDYLGYCDRFYFAVGTRPGWRKEVGNSVSWLVASSENRSTVTGVVTRGTTSHNCRRACPRGPQLDGAQLAAGG